MRGQLNNFVISGIVYTYSCGGLGPKDSEMEVYLWCANEEYPLSRAPIFFSTLPGYSHVRSSSLLSLRSKPKGSNLRM
jgi:hypothetical protein